MTFKDIWLVLVVTLAAPRGVGLDRPLLRAQTTPQAQRAEFDAASVKRNTSGQGPRGISFSPTGRFAWTAMTLKQLMQSAYGELEFKEIAGGPRWIDSERFDIVATSTDALADGTPRGLFARLRTLLEDRFQLKAHVESRVRPVYALQPVATPMVAGPDLRKTGIDCGAVIREQATGRRPQVPDGDRPPCSMRPGLGQLTGHGITMGMLTGSLGSSVDRPVIDRTGLSGTFDIALKWAPELPPGTLINGAPAPPDDGPSIFTAVREQLGLKLEATRAEVPVLVVDDAQMPTPD